MFFAGARGAQAATEVSPKQLLCPLQQPHPVVGFGQVRSAGRRWRSRGMRLALGNFSRALLWREPNAGPPVPLAKAQRRTTPPASLFHGQLHVQTKNRSYPAHLSGRKLEGKQEVDQGAHYRRRPALYRLREKVPTSTIRRGRQHLLHLVHSRSSRSAVTVAW